MNLQPQTQFDVDSHVREVAACVRRASKSIASSSTHARNTALANAAESLESSIEQITEQNNLDLKAAHRRNLSDAMLDRLKLTDDRIRQMAQGLRQVSELPDPVGEISNVVNRPSGIRVGRMRVPLGVIGIIYESRPNVTADAGALCLKSGNGVILRGGSEAYYSNQAIVKCLRAGLQSAQLPSEAIGYIETTDRSAIDTLISLEDLVDVIVPRGGKGLIERISSNSRVAVLKHLDGVCHVYVDARADLDKATPIIVNSKTHRYGVCNAIETLLVHKDIAQACLSRVVPAMIEKKVELRGCAASCKLFREMKPATEQDWYEEYLAPILAVRIVDSIDDAISHIDHYGSEHTDCIVTENVTDANRFLRQVDSSSVMVNASTRFADGFEYGLGAEIGISTNKLHARGPVGLVGLTMQKFIVIGDGHVRQ